MSLDAKPQDEQQDEPKSKTSQDLDREKKNRRAYIRRSLEQKKKMGYPLSPEEKAILTSLQALDVE